MQHFIKKIGLIQNAPLTADFSNNIRAIIQGYRECLDHGADIVIAPAQALCGLNPQDLAFKSSFLRQTQDALNALSHEVCNAPLILGAYTPFSDDSEDGLFAEEIANEAKIITTAIFLIEKDTVTELDEADVTDILGARIYVDTQDDEAIPDEDDVDLIVHLGSAPWCANSAQNDEEKRSWEARSCRCPVVSSHVVGLSDGCVYGGGSLLCDADGRPALRLPFFEVASLVAPIHGTPRARALPDESVLLSQALELAIRQLVRQYGYLSVCLTLDHPQSPLLAAICVSALGAAHVNGVTFSGNGEAAKALGINCHFLDASLVSSSATKLLPQVTSEALEERVRGALLTSQADAMGSLLLCPLTRTEIMSGDFTSYGARACGILAPLGALYQMDAYLLSKQYSEKYPQAFGALTEPNNAKRDLIIHELIDRNLSATEIIRNKSYLYNEHEVRSMQRNLIVSAIKREQLPPILHVEPTAECIHIPPCHRLND